MRDSAANFLVKSDLGLSTRKTTSTELRPREFWANKDISFELRAGQSLGIIGKNGAGKTTLLKMLAGLIRPNHGRIIVRGKMSALIALNAGFNETLTGRENTFVNGAILGLSRRQVQERLDCIVAFADLAEAIDSPVMNYSSGMKVRLGFGIAAFLLQPDVLILDEILAVGDSAFREKCYQRLAELRAGGTAFIVVAHNEQVLRQICTIGILLRGGELQAAGPIQAVLGAYNSQSVEKCGAVSAMSRKDLGGSKSVVVSSVSVLNHLGDKIAIVRCGESFEITIEVSASDDGDVWKQLAVTVMSRPASSMGDSDLVVFETKCDQGVTHSRAPTRLFRLKFDQCSFCEGQHLLKIYVSYGSMDVLDILDWGVIGFSVVASEQSNFAKRFLPHVWDISI